MNNFNIIKQKLAQFIRKYYTNKLIKGAILFVAIGALYFIVTLFVEYMLWLNPKGRLLLFWLFIGVALALFINFIAIPLSQLFKLSKGINDEQASKIIGNHFPEVNDKLLNILQLSESLQDSDLLLASIEQKSEELQPIPFKSAVSFQSNLKYLKYLAVPVAIVLLSLISGKINWFSDSYERVVNYRTAYEPPAPFQFFVLNDSLQAIEGKDFTLKVSTVGDVVPENVQINYNNEVYFLQPLGNGNFQHVFALPKEAINFQLSANDINSKSYVLNVFNTPNLLHFKMHLDYPYHTKKKDETLKSTGAAVIPEGTKVTWSVATKSTSEVHIYADDTLHLKNESEGNFMATKQLFKTLNYNITTSNASLKDYENLAYSITVVKDAYPELNVKMERDSLDQQSLYFYGQATDDYGISKLNLVYYPNGDNTKKEVLTIPTSKSNFTEFVTAFPDQLNIQDGVNYQLYFEAFDNDAIHNYKRTKSSVFNFRKRTENEEEQKQLQDQKSTINDINSTFEKLEKQDQTLKEFSKTQKEKKQLSFNDKKKFENFLKRQKQQEQLMKNFNKKLQDNLEEFQKDKGKDPFKEDLQKRLKENEQQLKKDEELLKELEKLKDKINKEEFTQKLEELAKQNKNKKRSMKQLLELTKRFYVMKKTEKIANQLDDLSKKQEELSKSNTSNTKDAQKKLNEDFKQLQKDLDTLERENRKLQKPTKVPRDAFLEDEINYDQQQVTEALEKQEKEQEKSEQQKQQKEAQSQQKKASQKMKQMSEMMKQSMSAGGGANQIQEDADMLRQILDNLLLYSFDQEALMQKFNEIGINHNKYGYHLIQQNNLREHFEHIDDSLFAMSLRQPKISEKVNSQITDVYFNIDKALDQLTENRLYLGVSSQQYAITASNELASFLSDVLDNLDEQMNPSSGQGQGEQLPDIIMSQEELNKQVEEQFKNNGKEESGQKPSEGKKGEEGQEGDEGKEGQQGDEGENGEQSGQQGESGQQAQNGNDGRNGKGKQGENEADGGENGKKGKRSKGKDGEDGREGYGKGGSEEQNAELYKIYQQQQKLRQALENRQLQDKLRDGEKTQSVGELIRQMENIESDLLNYGITNEVLSKMMNVQHQMLKLEHATFLQGEDEKRQSETNTKEFSGTSKSQIPIAKQYFKTTEILNRQALPLKTHIQKKVQEYFKSTND